MDNASKALIMAGAILISIAIVGVGVYIFSTTSDLGSSAADRMSAIEAETTNKELTQFAGDRVRGTEVKALMEKISVINSRDTLPNDVTYSNANLDTPAEITDNKYYKVSFADAVGSDGFYDQCIIATSN